MKDLFADVDRYVLLKKSKVASTTIEKLLLVLTSPSLFAIAVHRYGYWVITHFSEDRQKYMRIFLNTFYHLSRKICMIRGKFDILDTTPIGPGFVLSDKGHVTIGANNIGKNVTVSNNVTIGMDLNGKKSILQDDVFVGNDSIVYGDITVHEGSVIEPESVLTRSIPGRVAVKGNPARVAHKDINSEEYIEKCFFTND